jgi:ABC-type polysaccharide/polyol phosphate export permease
VALRWTLQGFDNVPALLSLIPTIVLLFIFGWALAICVGVLNVLFQDCQHLTEVLLQVLYFFTPIFYYPDKLLEHEGLRLLYKANPLVHMVDLLREPILLGNFPSWQIYGMTSIAVAIAVVAAALTLMRFERRIIFYL